jgi:hypothetical protein
MSEGSRGAGRESVKRQYKMFVFGETLQKTVAEIPESEQLRFYRIIVDYGINGIEPKLAGFEAAVWVQIKAMIDNTMPKKRGAPGGNGNAKGKNNSPELFQEKQLETNETIKDELFQEKQLETNETIKDELFQEKQNAPMYNGNGNVNENEKGNGNSPASFQDFLKPSLSGATGPPEKDYVMVFEEVKSRWKEGTGQETRETLFAISPAKRERFINTLAMYSLEDIANAITNYWYAKTHPDEYDIKGRVYGTLAGFLENGVSQFYLDDTVKANFGRQAHGD